MKDHVFNVLFLCTCNSARSLIAEAQLNAMGQGRFKAYSAGSFPTGSVNPMALEFLKNNGLFTPDLHSKSWDEFAAPDAPHMDFVITVCDETAEKQSPYWPGQPISAHWSVKDPSAVTSSVDAQHHALIAAAADIQRRVELLTALPTQSLDRMSLQHAVTEIGHQA